MRGHLLLLIACYQLSILRRGVRGGGTEWASAEEEAKDEVDDPKLFQAVFDSIREWEANHHNNTRRKRSEGSGVCYEGVGCFRDTGYLEMVPSSPDEVDTRFIMYNSRKRSSDLPLIDVQFANVSSIYEWAPKALNMSAPTKVIVHGFGSSCDHVWIYEMRSALMSVENCNVICVDWNKGATFPNYVRAAANTRLIGRQLSILLSNLKEKAGLQLDKVHVIGFSLGAHVAAFAGSQLQTLNRISGLDPAGPLFEAQEASERLDPSDAKFVDVIHSNGETLILGGLGSWQPMGHVDFYPNGGRMQKGCSNLFVGAFTDILWTGGALEGRSLCNHRRAYKFFTDSVSPKCPFPALPCPSYEAFLAGECFPCPQGEECPSMGYYADASKARGSLYLLTREEEPFCANQYLVRLDSTPSVLPVVSYGKIELTLSADAHIKETFALTHKEDEELIVGRRLSRIVVAHPALRGFKSATLLYTAYAGWISSGLAKWSVDSLSLTDSFGQQVSYCKNGLLLESGVPLTIHLTPGPCSNSSSSPIYQNVTIGNGTEKAPEYTEVVFFGGDEEGANDTVKSDSVLSEAWSPLLDQSGNSLDNDSTYARAFRHAHYNTQLLSNDSNKMSVKSEPYLYEKIQLVKESRSMGNRSSGGVSRLGEIEEPILGATTPKSRSVEWSPQLHLSPPPLGATPSWNRYNKASHKKSKKLDLERSEISDKAEEFGGSQEKREPLSSVRSFSVQLFPKRLIAFLEQAEKYARLAFSPLFGSNIEGDNEGVSRGLKLFSWGESSEVPLRHLTKSSKKYIPLERAKSTTPSSNLDKETEFNLPSHLVPHIEAPILPTNPSPPPPSTSSSSVALS